MRSTDKSRLRKSSRFPHVLIIYNEPTLPEDHHDAVSEHEILYTTDEVSKALNAAGFPVSCLGITNEVASFVAKLHQLSPNVVFNLFEGTANDSQNEAYMAGILEWLKIPFTGSPSQTLWLARDKPLTKYVLKGAGLPTPSFFVVEKLPIPKAKLPWPVIIKPAHQDASVGLDQNSVATSQRQLIQRIKWVMDQYGSPVLVEEFIPGRELTIGLIEAPDLQCLPPSEILFVDKDPKFWPIVTFDAKWIPESRDYVATPPLYPAKVSRPLLKRLNSLAQQAFRLLGCRDYARVDFRVTPSGQPFILEVNPNPDFSPVAGLSGGLGSAGITHAQFSKDLVWKALKRSAG